MLLAACSIYELEREPSTWSPGCVGGSPLLRNVAWQGWGAPTATATGEALLNDCEPSCAEGTGYEYPAQMASWRVRTCHKSGRVHREYTRVLLRWEYPEDNPFGADPGWSEWKLHVASNDCRRKGEPFHRNPAQAGEIAVTAVNLTLARTDWDTYSEGSVTRATRCRRVGGKFFTCHVFARASDLDGFSWWRGKMRIGIGKRRASWHLRGTRRKCRDIFHCGPAPFSWHGKVGLTDVSVFS